MSMGFDKLARCGVSTLRSTGPSWNHGSARASCAGKSPGSRSRGRKNALCATCVTGDVARRLDPLLRRLGCAFDGATCLRGPCC